MPDSNNSHAKELGIIIGKLESIEKRLDRQDESRNRLHARVNDLVLRQTHQEADVHSIKAQVEGMNKITASVEKLRIRAEGAGTLGKFLLWVGGGILSAAGGFSAAWMLITGRPPP